MRVNTDSRCICFFIVLGSRALWRAVHSASTCPVCRRLSFQPSQSKWRFFTNHPLSVSMSCAADMSWCRLRFAAGLPVDELHGRLRAIDGHLARVSPTTDRLCLLSRLAALSFTHSTTHTRRSISRRYSSDSLLCMHSARRR